MRLVGIAEKGVGVCLLLELLARGKNRLFSPVKVRPICFAEQAFPLSAFSVPFLSPAYGGRKNNIVVRGQLPSQVFRLRRKTITEQKEIASGRRRCAGASSLFIGFRELQKTPRHFLSLFGVIRGSRAA